MRPCPASVCGHCLVVARLGGRMCRIATCRACGFVKPTVSVDTHDSFHACASSSTCPHRLDNLGFMIPRVLADDVPRFVEEQRKYAGIKDELEAVKVGGRNGGGGIGGGRGWGTGVERVTEGRGTDGQVSSVGLGGRTGGAWEWGMAGLVDHEPGGYGHKQRVKANPYLSMYVSGPCAANNGGHDVPQRQRQQRHRGADGGAAMARIRITVSCTAAAFTLLGSYWGGERTHGGMR